MPQVTHHAPAPPVSPDKKVDSAQQPCPLKAKKQCELTLFEVKTKYVSTGDATATTVVTKLETKKKRRHEVIPPNVASKIGANNVALLAQYDLLIEALAGFPCKGNEEGAEKAKEGEPRIARGVAKETKSPANVAEIEFKTDLEGTCGVGKHVVLKMKPGSASSSKVEIEPEPEHGESHMVLEDAEWAPGVKKVEIKDIIAPTFKADILGGDNPFSQVIRLVMWVWNVNKSLDLEVRAESCGIHTPTEMGIHDLNALVRVYRDVSVAIGIKVPPVKKVTETSEKLVGIGTSSTAVTHASSNGTSSHTTYNETNHKTGFKGTEVFKDAPVEEFALYFKFNELEFLLKETRDKAKEQAEGLNEARKNATEKYKHWHDEHARKAAIDKAIKDAFSDFLTFRDKIELFFEGFVAKVRMVINAIRSALDLMKKFPQMGFKLTFEIGFLSGDLFFGWAHAPLDSSQPYSGPLADRYAPLLHKLHFESKISLITFKVEASFGLMIDAGAVGSAEARVAGSLSLEIAWQTMLDVIVGSGASNGPEADVLTQMLSGTTTGNLRATLQVKVAWFSYKAEIGIESGIVVDGRIEWKLMKGEIAYSLNVRSLETGWYIYSTDLKTGRANVTVHKIFEARPLMAPLVHKEKL